MYICICMCIYIYIHTYVCMIYVYIYIVHASIHASIQQRACSILRISASTLTSIILHCVCMYVCMCISYHIYIYIYRDRYTQTHIHSYAPARGGGVAPRAPPGRPMPRLRSIFNCGCSRFKSQSTE